MTSTETPARDWKYWTEPEWLDVDGRRTAYRRKGSGPPLLYLNGAGLTRAWLPIYDKLAEQFDVIVPEHPGFGDTPMPDTLHSFSDLVLHYDALLRQLGIESPHVFGHSFGGWAASDFAIFYPERLASLTLLAPMGLRVVDDPQADPFRKSPERMVEMLLGPTADRYTEYLEQEGGHEQTIHMYSESIAFARLTWNPRYDWRLDHRLGRIRTPTLVICPADDRYIPRSHCERYAELIPDARLEVVQGTDGEEAAHLLILQQPERVTELIAGNALG